MHEQRSKSSAEKSILRSERVNAKTVSEARDRISKRANAGGDSLQRILDESIRNPNSPTLRKFKNGNYFFFFGTTSQNAVTCLYWTGTKFDRLAEWLGARWKENYRAVFRR